MRKTPREVRNFKSIKEAFLISNEQHAVLIGTLLGDGTLAKRGREYRLHIKHGFTQYFYVEYKHMIFANITSMPIRVFDQKVKNKSYRFSEFVTLTHPEFTKTRFLFYPDGKKVITPKLCTLITHPLTLATWFMDDGTHEYAGASLSTHCFSLFEITLLQKVLESNFGLPTLHRRNKRGWVIYIRKQHLPILRNIIGNYLLPEFQYKLQPYSENYESRRDYTLDSLF